MTDQPLLEVSALHKRYRSGDGVAGLDLTVGPGEVLALVGPNGAGKTTTVRCIAGLLRPDHGRIRVLGVPAGSTAAKLRTAVVPDNPELYSVLTVEEHLRFRAQAFRIGGDLTELIDSALADVGLEDLGGRVGGELSRGQRQRVMLAAALVQDAVLHLLDEPTIGLDPPGLDWLEAWITGRAAHGAGFLVTTHQMDFVARVATRVVLMREGTVVREFHTPRTSGDSAETFRSRLVDAFERL